MLINGAFHEVRYPYVSSMPSRNSEYSRAFRNVDLEPISEFRSNFRTLSDKFFQGDQTVRKIFRVVDCSESTDFLVFSQRGGRLEKLSSKEEIRKIH